MSDKCNIFVSLGTVSTDYLFSCVWAIFSSFCIIFCWSLNLLCNKIWQLWCLIWFEEYFHFLLYKPALGPFTGTLEFQVQSVFLFTISSSAAQSLVHSMCLISSPFKRLQWVNKPRGHTSWKYIRCKRRPHKSVTGF